MEEKDAPESPETQSENIEEVKQETGFIATIKNRVGGFFYSHQDSKSDTSSSKYLTVYINLNCLWLNYTLIFIDSLRMPV